MKLTVFQATDGDCLLIEGQDETQILVDGGRKGSFMEHCYPTLAELHRDGLKLDLVCVSHIDNDHISGVLSLTEQVVKWKVYDFQHGTNPQFPRPSTYPDRPPQIDQIWHNAFSEMVGDLDQPIEDMLVLAGQSFLLHQSLSPLTHQLENLITGVNEAVELNLRLRENLHNIPLNQPYGGKLMHRKEQPESIDLNNFEIKVLGPTLADLEDLKEEWKEFLEGSTERVDEIKAQIEEEGRQLGLTEEAVLHRTLFSLAGEFADLGEGTISIPNIASLVLLVEENINGVIQRVLLTGDAGSQEILDGLKAHGLIDDHTGIHLDVLKIQHHGAGANITEKFCKTVTADHYIFCGNGAHHNPDTQVIEALVEARLGSMATDSISPLPDRPFRFWFNSSTQAANTSTRKEHMKAVEEKVGDLKEKFGRDKFSTRFLRRGSYHIFHI